MKPAFIRSLVETRFDYRSRLRLLFYRENRVFRSLICTQLFQSFLQFPEISESPYYARRKGGNGVICRDVATDR